MQEGEGSVKMKKIFFFQNPYFTHRFLITGEKSFSSPEISFVESFCIICDDKYFVFSFNDFLITSRTSSQISLKSCETSESRIIYKNTMKHGKKVA